MSIYFKKLTTGMLLTLLSTAFISCSLNDEKNQPDAAHGEGKGDATNVLRYQNRKVK